MHEFINKILKEAEKAMNDDSFFKPKDIKKRMEGENKKRKELTSKIKLGLQNIKEAYENKDWNSEQEKLFLQIFFKLRLDEKYNKQWSGYFLKDENNTKKCSFNLKDDRFWCSYEYVWEFFSREFRWNYDEIQQFMKQMLKEHFKLYEFTPGTNL